VSGVARMPQAGDAAQLLVPEGTRLVHIGPHKTGTTALQGALYAAREALVAQGVRHPGRSRNPAHAVRDATGQDWPVADAPGPLTYRWRDLVRDVRRAREPRVVLSSEFFAWADPAAIRRIVDDLDPARVHVVVTLRPLARILPSHWQQNVQGGAVAPYARWLATVLEPRPGKAEPSFWHLHRHDRLIARWAEVVGPENVTAIALDEGDRGFVLRAFEQLLGVRGGTLTAVSDLSNRSLTLPEVEAVRAFNVVARADGLDRALQAKVMRLGAAQILKQRQPHPDEPRIETPQWALDRATTIGREMVANIGASGVRVVGDLDGLAAPQRSRPSGDRQPDPCIPPEVAAALAMGIVAVSGALRGRPLPERVADPHGMTALDRAATNQVAATVAYRARDALVVRSRRLTRRRR
jgi:hypothetical protein